MKKTLGAVAATVVGMTGLVATGERADASTSPCAGVSGCRVVTTADVDGDGHGDGIGIVQHSSGGVVRGDVVVRVRLWTGRRVSTTTRVSSWPGSSFRATTLANAGRGREIVIGTSAGAHTTRNRFITYRGGRLVTLAAPGGASRWMADSSASTAAGFQRQRSGSGRTLVTRRVSQRDSDSGRWYVTGARYMWSAGRWARVATTSGNPSYLPSTARGFVGFTNLPRV